MDYSEVSSLGYTSALQLSAEYDERDLFVEWVETEVRCRIIFFL